MFGSVDRTAHHRTVAVLPDSPHAKAAFGSGGRPPNAAVAGWDAGRGRTGAGQRTRPATQLLVAIASSRTLCPGYGASQISPPPA